MKNNIILGALLTFFTVVGINAQDKDSKPANSAHQCGEKKCCVASTFAPQKGDFTAQMLFGQGAYLNSDVFESSVVPSSGTDGVSTSGPYVNDVSSNSNSATNMIGAQFKYFTSDKFAITFSGGAILRNTPYKVNTPGVQIDGEWIIPAYSAVQADERAELNFAFGAEYLLKSKNDRLVPYVGVALPFDYARRSLFMPPTIDSEGNVSTNDTGARHYEITALSAQAVAGADYYLAKDFFLGFDIKPITYTYAYSIKSPAPEFNNLDAENNTVSFFAQFSFKLGFKF